MEGYIYGYILLMGDFKYHTQYKKIGHVGLMDVY